MQKRHREISQIVQRAGLTCESITPGANGHIRVMTTAPNGQAKTFFMPGSPSDWRADKNSEADMRRFARDNPGAQKPKVSAIGEALIKAARQHDEKPTTPVTTQEPTTQPEPSPMTTTTDTPKARIPKNQLTHAEFYQLCEWVKATDLSAHYTYVSIERYASQALQIGEISTYSLTTAMETVGKELAKAPAPAVPKDRVRVVARVLADLLRELGKEVPKDLATIIGGQSL